MRKAKRTAAAVFGLAVGFGSARGQQADPSLVMAQQMVDAGRLTEAETSLRSYLAAHPASGEAHALLGYALLKLNHPQASLAEYNESAKYRAPQALDFVAMGSDYLLLEDSARAAELLQKAYAAEPQNPVTLYLLGRAAYNRQHFDEAVDWFRASLKQAPDNAKAEAQLGRALQRLGKTDEALAAFRRAVALEGAGERDAELRTDFGSLLIESGQATEAIPVLTEAVRLAPAEMKPHRELGKAYLRAGELSEAKSELEAAKQLDEQNGPTRFLLSQAYNRLGQANEARQERAAYAALTQQASAADDPLQEARGLAVKGQWNEAEQTVRRYLASHAASADGHYLLAYVLFRQKNARASLAEYTEAAKYRTPTATDLEAVASDYVLLHDYPDAERWFAKAVEWQPTNFRARYFLARSLYNENRFDEAAQAFEECLKLDPKSVKAKDNLGLTYEGLGKAEEAEAAYRAAIAWQSDAAQKDPGPYVNLGALLVNAGKAQEAIPLLREAARVDPTSLAAHRELGKAYSHLDQLEQAQRELEQAVALAPAAPVSHYLLSQVYRKRGLTEKARVETEKYRALVATHSSDAENSLDQAVQKK